MTNDSVPTVVDLATICNEVRTERLVLRHPRTGDGPAIFAVHGDPMINQYKPAGMRRQPDLDTKHSVFALGWMPASSFYDSL